MFVQPSAQLRDVKGFSGFVDLLDLATDPGNDSALVLINRPQRHSQGLGHDLGRFALNPGLPERLPGEF